MTPDDAEKDRRIAELETIIEYIYDTMEESSDGRFEWRGAEPFEDFNCSPRKSLEAHDLAIRTDERRALLSKIHIKWACSSEQGFRKWFVRLLQDDAKARAAGGGRYEN